MMLNLQALTPPIQQVRNGQVNKRSSIEAHQKALILPHLPDELSILAHQLLKSGLILRFYACHKARMRLGKQ